MCGVFGAININVSDLSDSIVGILKSRGPDHSQYFERANTCFIHTRLSIRDVTDAANQPMLSSCGRYLLCYNGEIYNSEELRESLGSKGYRFSTTSDTEVLLYELIEHGVSALSSLNGIFAFAFYDFESEKLVLARDHLGIKPLYYYYGNNQLVFSSDIGAVEQCLEQCQINRSALTSFLQTNYFCEEETLYQNVLSVKSGSYLKFDLRHESFESEAYYNLEEHFEKTKRISSISELGVILKKVVKRQLLSDVPVGAFLSGGIDSSLLAIYANEIQKGIRFYHANFKDENFSEMNLALKVADYIGIELSVIDCDANITDTLIELSQRLSHPHGDSSILPTYMMCRKASKDVKVCLSGDGPDELLLGYDTYRATELLSLLPMSTPKSLASLLGKLCNFLPQGDGRYSSYQKAIRIVRNLPYRFPETHANWRMIFSDDDLIQLLKQQPSASTWRCNYASIPSSLESSSIKEKSSYMDLRFYLSQNILKKVDLASMATGLEVRVPFLDKDLVSYFISLENKHKEGSLGGKQILKELLVEHLGLDFVRSPKSGFTVPLNELFRTGDFAQLFLDIMKNQEMFFLKYFNVEIIFKFFQDHKNGKADYSFELYNLLSLGLWSKRIKYH